ncbi:hypothetical protein [Micromonospora sp. NBC_01813]|uniref:hypothetical protein n=1 Tax=Micromonospora sp. NBC_01813 TaxID=2975988 RepID=UPI002DDA0693|nr:hypothetical protein [Micromonospora sp. NBC_01813]WSA10283.1 hypothetical protein OG958_05675 [Micromonospora sp. NBC_01813]
MRLRTSRLRVAIAAVATVIVTGGCDASESTPQPAPEPRYEKIPEDICSSLRLSVLFEEFSLTIPTHYEPASGYRTERDHWYELCTFAALGRDGRFATELGDFQPDGAIEVQIYHNVAGAVEAYEQDTYNYFDLRKETVPDTTTTDITGWWGDSGKSLQSIRIINPDYVTYDPFEIPDIRVMHLIRHDNLVIMAYADAVSLSSETDEALALLHDLTSALIDETVSHLDG